MLYVVSFGVILMQWSYAMPVIWYFFIDSTYKTNMYRFPLLNFVGVTLIGMIFSASFAYLEGECVNNVVWDLERFQGLFLIPDALPRVIVTNRDLTFINIVKIVFLECTNLLYRFHIDKNVKTKCKTKLIKLNWKLY